MRFLDPCPIYLSTDQKTLPTLIFGDLGSWLYLPIYEVLTHNPYESWIPVLSTYYLSTDQKTLTTAIFWDLGSRLYPPIYRGFDT